MIGIMIKVEQRSVENEGKLQSVSPPTDSMLVTRAVSSLKILIYLK